MEYASKGLAGTALGFGIGGAAMSLANGGLSNLLGGLGQNNKSAAADVAAAVTPAMTVAAMLAARQQEPTCNENMRVTRYDLNREQQLAAKDSEIALLKANAYNDQKMLEVYAYIDGQLKDVRKTLCDQAVHNQRTEDSFALVKQDVDCVRKEALDAVKMEAERRCCGDNSIVTYVNATFYPKQVADVTTGPHWTMEQTSVFADARGIDHDIPRWAWGVTMNMMYSDYYNVAMEFGVNRPEFYAALAKAFLMDKDGPEPEEKLCAYYKYIVMRGNRG